MSEVIWCPDVAACLFYFGDKSLEIQGISSSQHISFDVLTSTSYILTCLLLGEAQHISFYMLTSTSYILTLLRGLKVLAMYLLCWLFVFWSSCSVLFASLLDHGLTVLAVSSLQQQHLGTTIT